jgi:hypothetical protein
VTMNRPIILDLGTMRFALDATDGLKALRWENRLTGRILELGGGPEVEFDIGLPDQPPLVTPKLRVTGRPSPAQAAAGEAVFTLEADEPPARVTVTYRWNTSEPVLHKFVTIENLGGATWNRLLNVRLGDYATGTAKLTGGELQVAPSFRDRAHRIGGLQGFPIYAGDEFFLSLAHPAGWANQEPGKVSLRHYPGAVLKPGESRECMEAVYGVGPAGEARAAFVAHVRRRMRRVVRGHDRPYAIFEPFGGRTDGSVAERNRSADAAYAAGNLFDENELYLLDMIAKVAEGQHGEAGRFDFTSFEFWVDNKSDIKQADPWRFPNQFERIKAALRETGIVPGLWLDSSFCGWSIGGNPAAKRAIVQDVPPDFCEGDAWKQWETQAYFCRATEPVRSMYTEGFLHHIRENGVRLLKFDNFNSQCSNPAHDHLPGVYGNEATHEAVIESYRAFDAACPDVFIMLYWGYRSPWWLLHADTMFETGVEMEAASPGHMPALYVRDGVTRKLDQGHMFAKDVPWLGTDSLGIWLSHWGGWNSGIGPERWQQGFVMDICRGHALAQIWTDPGWLTPPERRQVHEFIALMKAQPDCFTNARLVLGDPWKAEPYGYSCSDGRRAFLAINNGTWEDRVVSLDLGPAWGLECDGALDIYRWYPDPARLAGGPQGFRGHTRMAMRPFEVVLLEIVPHGDAPSLPRTFRDEPMPAGFAEASCPVPVQVAEPGAAAEPWTVSGTIPASAAGGTLAVVLELADESGQPLELGNLGSFFAAEATVAGAPAMAQPALGPEGYPSSWQTWRIAVPPNTPAQPFAVCITDLPGKSSWMNAGRDTGRVQRRFSTHFLPRQEEGAREA